MEVPLLTFLSLLQLALPSSGHTSSNGVTRPVVGATDQDCLITNIPPIGLLTYLDITTKNGRTYFLVNTTGHILLGTNYSGVVFKLNGNFANSWTYCSDKCLDYCDSHDCLSFNIFTFQEEDYENCQPTCECRSNAAYYDVSITRYGGLFCLSHDQC